MLTKLKPKSEFSRNVVTLMTGTTIAQAIPIAISPILTRLYTPDDFGVYAVFIAITAILGSIANGRYELAIMLPKKDEDAINILALGFIINIVLSIFLLFVVIFFHNNILNLLNNKEISNWLYIVPISVFLMGCFNLLNYFNNRKKLYNDLAKANVIKSIGMAIVQLVLGLLNTGVIGLVSGNIFSQIISNTKLFFNIKKLNVFFKVNKVKIMILGKLYKKFPLYSLPSVFFNTISLQIVPVLLSSFFIAKIIGFYYLAHRLISMPMSLIGGSIGQVFFQKASILKNNKKEFSNFVFDTYYKLLKISIVPFAILLFYSDLIFSFVFGKQWIMAGEFAMILSPWLLFVFLGSPISTVVDIVGRQRDGFLFNFSIVVVRVSIIIFGGLVLKDAKLTIILYSIVGVFFWMFWNFYILYISGINLSKIFFQTFEIIIPVFIIFYGLRIMLW